MKYWNDFNLKFYGKRICAKAFKSVGFCGRWNGAEMKTTFHFRGIVLAFLSLLACSLASAQTNSILTSIRLTPANPALIIGSNLQFTATGTYSDASTRVLAGTNWVNLA